jgi:hypothetical protein
MARCPQCGRELRAGALDGLCPACLMRQVMASDDTSGESSVRFTTSLSSTTWTLVTLLADDEECVTYLARPRENDGGPGANDTSPRLAQLVVRKERVPSAEQAAARRQLQTRRDALRRLSHPALAPVLDASLTDEGHPFLVTAFVMATPLADLSVDEPATGQLRDLLHQAEGALQTLHGAGLAHGRIRSSTVLGRRTTAGATAVVTGFAPLTRLPTPALAIADDLTLFQRLTSTLRI